MADQDKGQDEARQQDEAGKGLPQRAGAEKLDDLVIIGLTDQQHAIHVNDVMVEKVIAYQKQRGGEGQHQQRSHAEGGKKNGETSQDAKEIDGKGGVDLVVVVGGDLAVGHSHCPSLIVLSYFCLGSYVQYNTTYRLIMLLFKKFCI